MKNFILGLVVGAALVFLGTYVGKTYAQTITFDTNLSYGSTGSEVSALQEFLVEQGVLNPQYVTGNFYSVTLAAVKEFQTKESISPVSGFVGPITRSTINTLLEQEVPVSEGNAATTTEPIDLSQVTPIVTAPIVLSQVQQIAPAVETAPCVSNPALTMQIPTPAGSEVQVMGHYSTGCPLNISDLEKNYIFTAQINNQYPVSPGGFQSFDVEDSGLTLGFSSNELYPIGANIIFNLTIGSITSSAVTNVPSQN